MPPLTDPDRLAAYRDALRNWRVSNYIQFDLTEEAYRWLRREVGDITLKEIAELMCRHVEAGGEIDEVPESRPQWSVQWEFHWDLRVKMNGKLVYIETRLHYRLPVVADEPWILVVNIHEAS